MSEELPPKQHAIGNYIAQSDRGATATVSVYQILSPYSISPRDRSNLLENVRTSWIEGVLESSLFQSVPIQLEKELYMETVERPKAMRLITRHQSGGIIPRENRITNIYEEMGRALLILGEAGSGKTTTMLELTRDLIAQAEQDPTLPIPVVVNLSSWDENPKQSIDAWLVSELRSMYGTPMKIGRSLIEEHALIALLDGLDEVRQEYQQECLIAINRFHAAYVANIVVCCRKKEYDDLLAQHKVRLHLGGAILLHPPSIEQIDDYLSHAGPRLSALHAMIDKEPALQDLALSPLTLSIMCMAYQDITVDTPFTERHLGLPDPEHTHLFETYVDCMFQERMLRPLGNNAPHLSEERNNASSKKTRYSRELTLRWLSWLARSTSQRTQSVFFLEQLQPDWLQTKMQRWLYVLCVGLCVGLLVCLSSLLIVPLIDLDELSCIPHHYLLPFFTVTGVTVGLPLGIISMVVGAFKAYSEIETVEALHWSWSAYKRNILWLVTMAFLIGALFTAVASIVFLGCSDISPFLTSLVSYPVSLFLLFLSVILPLLTTGGLRGRRIEKKVVPNQGIRQSAKNATILGAVILGTITLSFSLYALHLKTVSVTPIPNVWKNDLVHFILFWVGVGLSFALPFGLVAILTYGGFTCIQHFVLRLILCFNGLIPWNYVRFLDYATEHVFLRKVGGGYIFIHEKLRKYFAELDEPIFKE